MFCVSYLVGKFNDRRHRDFCSYASAQLYFLQKYHENRPGLTLSVSYEEPLDCVLVECEEDS